MRDVIFLSILLWNGMQLVAQEKVDCGNNSLFKSWIKGFKSGDTIMRNTLVNGQITAEKRGFTILSYDVSILEPGYDAQTFFKFTDKNFMPSLNKAFRKVRPHSFIVFENILARDKKGHVVCLQPCIYIMGQEPAWEVDPDPIR